MAELARLGYRPDVSPQISSRDAYFAGSLVERLSAYFVARVPISLPLFFARGGYGSNYLLPFLDSIEPPLSPDSAGKKSASLRPKPSPPGLLLGYSDLTSLLIYYWQKFRCVTFYGPMVAAGFDAGAGKRRGYDLDSFRRAVTQARSGWTLRLKGATLRKGRAEGILLGGCLSILQTTLGTPSELDTRGAILLLEDRGMRPFQVDRALMHLEAAGKFEGVRGFLLGEFPECEPPSGSKVTVREVLKRVLGDLEVPMVWRAPVGHTSRPMLTIPLGVRARLVARGSGRLDILEPACVPPPPSS
jgi:muramoyltetrapeptide carboxypeptidase